MIELKNLFDISYGNGYSLNALNRDENGVNFVSRSSINNGVSGKVQLVQGIDPFPSGTITVALSGSVLESFIQPEPFYTAYHIFCLTPLEPMSFYEKIYYCMCIKNNKYRYNYGRQANRTLKDVLVPSRVDIPKWVYESEKWQQDLNIYKKDALEPFQNYSNVSRIKTYTDSLIPLSELFNVIYGTNLELNALQKDSNGINFVSRTSKNNGVSAKVKRIANVDPIPAGMLTVAAGGSVLETFVQLEPFYSGRDLYYLEPLDNLTLQERLYYCLCIRSNKYKYNYGRQANRTLGDLLIPSPDNIPIWVNRLSINDSFDNAFRKIIENLDDY